ncbi:DUF7521 family protein [Haloprofundus salilacus]|uniref:DUF7521 family protein n=1 Tax=Haloprofundus salilacus TaxID=2876190 RepID=UPI001CCECCC5|nr:hypothetical protein [Haloprofundus salilacus]
MVSLASPIGLAAGGVATASAIIGLYIGFHAYRGLRRHDDPSMRYLSIGMILLFGITYVFALAGQGLIAFRVIPIHLQNVVRLVVRVIQFVGLAFIAYSLRIAVNR